MTLTRIRALLWRTRHLLVALTFLAALLTVVQAIGGLKPEVTTVVVAGKQLSAGKTLAREDVVVAHVPTELVPDGALTDPSEVVGEVLVSALPRGMPVPRSLLLSADFLALAPPGEVIVSVTIVGDGTEDLAQPGTTVSVYAPPDEFSDTGAAILVAMRASSVQAPSVRAVVQALRRATRVTRAGSRRGAQQGSGAGVCDGIGHV